ncbi:MAG: S8 family peptidase [Thermoanaerobacteraceae bacterium]|nr:S8 family peptidase [Thermoanaerobacteraceae bacterium]
MFPLLLIPYYLLVGAAGAIFLSQKISETPKYKIVGFKSDLTLRKGQTLVEEYGIKVKKRLPLINACLCEVDADAGVFQSLSDDPMIEFIENDYEGKIQVMPTLSLEIKKQGQEIPWGIKKVGAPSVWKDTMGKGVRVGIIDTGVDPNHPDLKDNVKMAGWVLDCQNIIDDNGHGSHVAGTIAALDNDIGVVGVAPKVEIYAVKAFTKSGRGNVSDVIEGLNWCVKNKVQVINMSFGFKDSKALEKAIKEVYKRNIVLVAAAGNSGGNNSVMYPAGYPEVIAVAASNSDDKVAWFSSGGEQVDVIAPGVGILSTYKNGGYKSMSGTSMACPHVTAACALILSKSNLDPKGVKEVLINTAKDLGHSKTKQGAGLIDVSKAITSDN